MKERLLSRLGKMGSQAFISATSLRQEIESLSVERLERLARRLNLVKRSEFESLQAMVKAMQARIADLESVNASLRNKKSKESQKKSRAKSPAPRTRK